jgi:hypothetical protein
VDEEKLRFVSARSSWVQDREWRTTCPKAQLFEVSCEPFARGNLHRRGARNTLRDPHHPARRRFETIAEFEAPQNGVGWGLDGAQPNEQAHAISHRTAQKSVHRLTGKEMTGWLLHRWEKGTWDIDIFSNISCFRLKRGQLDMCIKGAKPLISII